MCFSLLAKSAFSTGMFDVLGVLDLYAAGGVLAIIPFFSMCLLYSHLTWPLLHRVRVLSSVHLRSIHAVWKKEFIQYMRSVSSQSVSSIS